MLRFHIANMTCAGCARGVAAILRDAGAHAELRIDLDRREVMVDFENSEAVRLTNALTQESWTPG